MLVASEVSSPAFLSDSGLGEFAGTTDIVKLQQALKGLSQAAGWPAANPGIVSGVVTTQTISSLGAVVANLAGLSSGIKMALQAALALAMTSSSARSQAEQVIGQYARYLTPAVLAMTAKYTRQASPPPAPSPPAWPSAIPVGPSLPATGGLPTAVVPATAVQAQSRKTGLWRVAVPQVAAVALGGPSVSLGAGYYELPPRTAMTAGIRVVSEGDLEKKVDDTPWYKNPWILGGIGAGVVVLGGGFMYMGRR